MMAQEGTATYWVGDLGCGLVAMRPYRGVNRVIPTRGARTLEEAMASVEAFHAELVRLPADDRHHRLLGKVMAK